jgi:hypothetical protein
MKRDRTTPSSDPTTAAPTVRISDPASTMRSTRAPVHPTARNTPISRVRSNTDTIIVSMTPIPPMSTASIEMATVAASRMAKPWSTRPSLVVSAMTTTPT